MAPREAAAVVAAATSWTNLYESWSHVRPLRCRIDYDHTWVSRFPLRTEGRFIVDSTGQRFRLKAVNWYGASDVLHVVGGLDVQSLDVICETIYNLGFNAVRLPFSNEMLRVNYPPDGSINYKLNPRLRGLVALEVYDEVIRSLGRHRIAVVVNNHTTFGEFCGPPSKNSLWFDPYGSFSEEQWMSDWTMLAKRYSKMPHVVAFDLRNEIRPRKTYWPTFQNPKIASEDPRGTSNWARASLEVARRLSKASPNVLFVVERLVWPQRGLSDMAAIPGALLPALNGRVVLGMHMYHWSGPGRFVPRWSEPPTLHWLFRGLRCLRIISPKNYGDMNSEALRQQMDMEFGHVLKSGKCPVWVSEFGADLSNAEEMDWLERFADLMAEFDADWAYWPLNVGPKPGSEGAEELYGFLSPDWRPKSERDPRLDLMARMGLSPPPDAPEEELGKEPLRPLRSRSKEQSEASLRSLFGSKDPLLAVKSAGDVRGALAWVPHQIKSGLRKVQTAQSSLVGLATGRDMATETLRKSSSASPLLSLPPEGPHDMSRITEEDLSPLSNIH